MKFIILAISCIFAISGCSFDLFQNAKESNLRSVVHLSPVYKIDKIYRSMEGPTKVERFKFPGASKGDLIWIRSISSTMVDENGTKPLDDGLMCHVNVDFDPGLHKKKFHSNLYITSRILTLSQGQMGLYFPRGYGFPVLAEEPFTLTTQVLNLNDPKLKTKVRHKITIKYVLDKEIKVPLKPLFTYAPYVMALIEGEHGHFNKENQDKKIAGAGCLPGTHAPQASLSAILSDRMGKKFSGHFVVPPGKQLFSTNVTHQMYLTSSTTIHSVAVHVHPFSESLELFDITAGKSVFISKSINEKNKIGLIKVADFSSVEGIEVIAGHEFELRSIYNNTSKTNQDSMAVMLLFMLDKDFQHPTRPGYRYDFQKNTVALLKNSNR